ncbi:hypothetical protein GQF56_19480 [Rhodobacter sphaeroides]|uniref:Uncharacterized protein n=1 Tax=Cereibacter sphaeroides (strain ATCC 17023 / DSM 158 / JCM 6121 / CCUG 31486 / LMG 2827 / NBRC 12203 / NCIMB 8253 / ATH 2.4.1.) TaxID=272943 RepID=Q3HKD5_CERS4|nr:conserved hypothetical protein/putative transcriptional regulator [Cereibacter sphaeroides 2.4.1]MVX50040.1 hypothetical protein [Cereibacter sphaeroides]
MRTELEPWTGNAGVTPRSLEANAARVLSGQSGEVSRDLRPRYIGEPAIELCQFIREAGAQPLARMERRLGADDAGQQVAHCLDREPGIGQLSDHASLLQISGATRELLGWHLSRSGKASTAASPLEHALINRFGTLGRPRHDRARPDSSAHSRPWRAAAWRS